MHRSMNIYTYRIVAAGVRRRRWPVAAGSSGDSRCGGARDPTAALETNGGAGETNGRRWTAAAEVSARRRRRRRELPRSRAPAAYIEADPLAPVRGWNRC